MPIHSLGNVPAGITLYLMWSSHDAATGANETMSGLATTDIEIYKNGSVTQRASDAGYALLDTDGIDFDLHTGINGISIDLADNTDAGFFAAGSWYDVIVGPVTIDTQTVNIHLATFRLVAAENTAGTPVADATRWNNLATVALPLIPTVAGRTLDVSAGGEAGIDWANIGSPTTANNLSATNIDVDQIVASVSGAVGSVTGAVGSVGAGGITAASFGAGAIDAAAIAANAIGASELAADAVAEIADAVWDEDATGHQTQGSYGQAIGDPVADTATIYAAVVTNAAGVDVAADIIAVKADTAAILVDTGTTLDGRIPAALVGGRMDANVGAISTDSVAADNAEAFFDGTGYAGTGNVIPTVTTLTNLPAITANWLTAAGTAADFGTEVANAVGALVIEGTVTLIQSLMLANAANAGKLSGAATTTITIRNLADTVNRIVATVDSDGNRSAVTKDYS